MSFAIMYRIKLRLVSIALLAELASGCGTLRTTSNGGTMTLKVSLAESDSAAETLQFKLTNAGRNPIEVFRSALPWESRSSLLLILVEKRPGNNTIPEESALDSPITGKQRLLPGQAIEGHIVLKDRFPSLPEVLRRSDIIAFWSYECEPIDNGRFERVGGWLLIPGTRSKEMQDAAVLHKR